MDSVNDIIRMVTRGFYDIRSVLIMDALLIHKVLSDDDMRQMLDIQQKEIRGLCSKLKEDHLLKDHLQKEEGNTYRPITKTYYYIHYTETVDAIKWKVHQTVKQIKDQMIADAYPQGYICPQCGERYSPLDAVALGNALGIFICSICDGELQEDDTSDEAKAKQATQARLMSQLHPIIETLRKIDDAFIPDNTFESSLSEARPPPSRTAAGIGITGFPDTGNSFGNSYSNYGSSSLTQQNGAASLQVNITTKSETAVLEKQALEAKARHAEENALPAWHVESTVGKTMYAGDGDMAPDDSTDNQDDDKSKIGLSTDRKASISGTASHAVGIDTKEDDKNTDIAAYFARLEATRKAQEEDDEEDEEDDDDDAEFEDVVPVDNKPAAASNDNDDDDDDDDDDEFEDI